MTALRERSASVNFSNQHCCCFYTPSGIGLKPTSRSVGFSGRSGGAIGMTGGVTVVTSTESHCGQNSAGTFHREPHARHAEIRPG